MQEVSYDPSSIIVAPLRELPLGTRFTTTAPRADLVLKSDLNIWAKIRDNGHNCPQIYPHHYTTVGNVGLFMGTRRRLTSFEEACTDYDLAGVNGDLGDTFVYTHPDLFPADPRSQERSMSEMDGIYLFIDSILSDLQDLESLMILTGKDEETLDSYLGSLQNYQQFKERCQ